MNTGVASIGGERRGNPEGPGIGLGLSVDAESTTSTTTTAAIRPVQALLPADVFPVTSHPFHQRSPGQEDVDLDVDGAVAVDAPSSELFQPPPPHLPEEEDQDQDQEKGSSSHNGSSNNSNDNVTSGSNTKITTQKKTTIATTPTTDHFTPTPISTHQQLQNTTSQTTNHTTNISISPLLAPKSPSFNPETPSTANTSPSSQTTAASQSSTPASTIIQARRPSPGLAARLKALGFGSSIGTDKSRDPSPILGFPDQIGRLPQDQIDQLDKRHQAGSLTSIIERRGRPWKGTSALFPPQPPPSLPVSIPALSLDPTPAATEQVEALDAPTPVANTNTGTSNSTSISSPPTILLPEITTLEPLDMDTQKYRLPDHTNGNGTKAQLETRQEHVDRSVKPPSPPPLVSDEMADDDDDDDASTPPPPLPKDTPPLMTPVEFTPDLASYFTSNHQRPGSIYTISRASLANQLAQLTSLQLPDAESLSGQVSAIPTATAASKALINAAEQIRSWISKASEVIAGLDSEDDVEWAAAGGREGLVEVENAALKFEDLIKVYVSAIEGLQSRHDIASVPPEDLKRAVAQMDTIITEWANIQSTLSTVKEQVEIAMEWEELWNMVLGDIQGEMDELCRLVFEMEERRHKSLMAAASGSDGVDIGDLETIVEENPPPIAAKLAPQTRTSLPAFPVSPSSPNTPTLSQDDSSLLALFARMQPLRASLDFLPMRLSVFEARANRAFPTACEELEMRRDGLDGTYKKLEKDAESLRKELGEDRWVLVFRGAGRQAQKMIESVERSLLKLKESVDAGMHLTNAPAVTKKIESYDAKKTHYGPAIERVLAIIDKGVKDRLTVNGEILRLHAEMQSKWESLKDLMKEMDAVLEEIHLDVRGSQLRDSVSSMLSNDRSTIGSGRETPGSSPPSSVIMSSLGLEPLTPTPKTNKSRLMGANSTLPQPQNRRYSSLPTPSPQLTRRAGISRLSSAGSSGIPSPGGQIPRPNSNLPHRPRWNGSTNTLDAGIGHNFKPLSLTTPSPYSKRTPAIRSASSLTPNSAGVSGSRMSTQRSPLNRSTSASPMPHDTPTRNSSSRLSFRDRIGSPGPPGPYAQQTLAKPRLMTASSTTSTHSNQNSQSTRRASLQPPRPDSTQPAPLRPASSLASGRRTSLLPTSRAKATTTGRESPQAIAGARSAMRSSSMSDTSRTNKPKWRH